MRLSILAVIVLVFSATQAHAQTTVDKFDIEADFNEPTLSLSLDTDLPDEAIVSVNVERYYWEVGNENAYALEYFSDKAPVEQWRQPREIELNNETWKAAFKQKQADVQKMLFDMNVDKISDKVTISMRVYPVQQPEGLLTQLAGKVVTQGKNNWEIIQQEVQVDYPINFKPTALPSLDPNNLTIGKTYIVSAKTPIMPHHSPPADKIMEALKDAKAIMPGGALTIIGQHDKDGTPWYEVIVHDAQSGEAIEGWVNGQVFYGQDLRIK